MAKKDNVKLKEQDMKEIIKTSSDINEQDYIVDDKIDDKYTKNLFEKHKKGETKNNWFTCSGIMSIIFGIICFVTMVIVGIVFISSIDRLKELSTMGEMNFDKKKMQVIVACIVIPIIGIISILIGIKVVKFANYKKQELPQASFKIMTFAVLQILFSGIIVGFISIIAYFMGISSDYGAIYYNRIDRGDLTELQLQDAKNYHQNELINDKEYENLKKEILSEKNIYF